MRHLSSVLGPLALVTSVLLLGCVSVQVEPLSLEPYPPRTGPPAALEAEPANPHVNVARFIATSESDYVDEDTLRGKILASAGQYGADAVVMGKYDVLESNGLGQTYQSTNVPGMQNSLFGGMGSGMPSFFDPWTYVQAPVDRVNYVQYQSGVAIRYRETAGAGLN